MGLTLNSGKELFSLAWEREAERKNDENLKDGKQLLCTNNIKLTRNTAVTNFIIGEKYLSVSTICDFLPQTMRISVFLL
jgi:hypothetical protein